MSAKLASSVESSSHDPSYFDSFFSEEEIRRIRTGGCRL